MTSSAKALLKSAGDRLPSPNGVALAIMELWEDERTTTQQLGRLVSADPALSGRLLKIANSAAMGNRPVAAIPEAVVRVGMQTVGQLAVAFSLIDSNNDGQCEAFDYSNYWSHCLLMAVLSRGLGSATRLAPPEDLFACGLLTRVGILALATVYPEEYSRLLQSQSDTLVAAEKEQFGIDHNELSEVLMSDYKVPSALIEPARYHENPQESKFDSNSRPCKLANLLHLAYRLANMALQSGADRSRETAVGHSIAAKLGLDEGALKNVFDQGLEEWQEWSKLFELPVREAPAYGDDQAEELNAPDPTNANQITRLSATVIASDSALKTLEDNLNALDVEVTLCNDHQEALQLTVETHPHLFFIPSNDNRLCRLLRSTEWGSSIYLFSVSEPLETSALIESYEAGADSVISTSISQQELAARLIPVRRVLDLERASRKDRSELRRIARELALAHRHQEMLSLTDELTDLPNRRSAMQVMKQGWSRSVRKDSPISVVMIDVDHFKNINDQLGHAAGDKVLRHIAAVLKQVAREDEVMARFGGEEFLLIGAGSGLRDMVVAAERIRRILEAEEIAIDDTAVRLTVSMGIAERDASIDGPDMLLNAADKALYQAKSTGRNRICFYQGGRIRSLQAAS